jgi:hypothetical protein
MMPLLKFIIVLLAMEGSASLLSDSRTYSFGGEVHGATIRWIVAFGGCDYGC